jgi:hypothetical protein
MLPQRFKIRSIVYEVINDDGTTEDVCLEHHADNLGYIKFLEASPNPDEEQHFWIASDHDGLTDGTNAIATGLPGVGVNPEIHRDRTNTMIGLIRDCACTAYVVYSPNSLDLAK